MGILEVIKKLFSLAETVVLLMNCHVTFRTLQIIKISYQSKNVFYMVLS